jgi:hypothetical protein
VRNEPDWPFATFASYQYTLTQYVVKECLFLWPANIPEAEIIFVNEHLSAPRATGMSIIAVTQPAFFSNGGDT